MFARRLHSLLIVLTILSLVAPRMAAAVAGGDGGARPGRLRTGGDRRDGAFVQIIAYREETASAVGRLRALIGTS